LWLHWDAIDARFEIGTLDHMLDALCAVVDELSVSESGWRSEARIPLPDRDVAIQRSANATAKECHRGLVHTPMLTWAARSPDATAIVSADGSVLSHGGLLARARAVAGRLPSPDSSGAPIAVAMPKGREQVVAVLACLLSGNAYMPLDPFQGEARIANIVAQTGCRCAMVTPEVDSGPLRACGVVCVEVNRTAVVAEGGVAANALLRACVPGSPAYVIFTSGSTGDPKGVIINHMGASNTCHDINERFAITSADRCLALSALGFDLSVYDIFGILGAGGSLVLPDPDHLRDPAHWLKLLERDHVTVWNSVPALMQMLVQYCEDHQRRLPTSLRLVMLSGDWVPVSLAERIRQLGIDPTIVALGGATEASIWSILHVIQRREYETTIPYGLPMANQSVHVLDHLLRPRPCHVPGDLYIGGIGLAEGYWGDAVRTARAFIEHPVTGERLYRTGDLGRWRADGEIEFLGREDSQVKVQGYRVELGEIEAALDALAQVERSVVVTVGARGEAQRLVVYVVLAAGHVFSKAALRTMLAGRLPAYMVPSIFVPLETLPLTDNGKIDRKRLPAPVATTPRTVDAGIMNVYQRGLCSIFADILSLPQVEPQLSFFDLGGTSLEVIEVVGAIKKAYGVEVSVADVFRHATPISLGLHTAELAATKDASVIAEEEAGRSEERLGLRRRRGERRRRLLPSKTPPQAAVGE
jgi:amino acid adenylation domain-containing protein